MLKQMGYILMLVSSMAMSAKECTINDINKDGGQVWEIPNDCDSLNLNFNELNYRGHHDYNVSHHKLGNAGAQALVAALKENKNIKLTGLDLGNNDIGDERAQALAAVFKENKNIKLTYLNLDSNDIGAQGAIALAESLEKNTLTQLDLADNNIGDKGLMALAEVLKKNETMIDLDLSGNGLRDTGAKALAAALKENRNIKLNIINLSNNDISDEIKRI